MVTTTKTVQAAARPTPGLPTRWRWTLGNALIITRREVRDSFRDWRIVAPIIILTLVFPSLAQFVAGKFSNFVADYGADIVAERTIPFMLMIVGFFPISISLVIALETFVGEKERRSLEPLLSTPLTNTELYIGKTLAAMIPPLIASYGGMLVYLGSLVLGELAWRPQSMLVVQIMLLTTVQALVMVTGAVVVSSQTTSTRAANLLASFIIIPMALLIQGESAIMFLAPDAESPNGIGALWAIIVGMAVVVIMLLRVGNSIFNREELLGRTIDQLNLRGTVRKLWQHIRAVDANGTPARSLWDWYWHGMPLSLRRLKLAAWLTLVIFVAAFVGGYVFGQQPEYRLPLQENFDFAGSADVFAGFFNLPTRTGIMTYIFWNNARVLLGATILGLFTFGIGGLIISPTFFVLGYVLSQILLAGYDPALLAAALLPHGILEIPIVFLASAAAVRLGASITRPPKGLTVGQGLQQALGDTVKIGVGLVLPGLIIAAAIEAFITPGVVIAVMGT
jgi:uncharacterized membrane protein SpoIIM required for sporulation/ABC-type transport system involved in multi-copper enzyme maturation permease subunit